MPAQIKDCLIRCSHVSTGCAALLTLVPECATCFVCFLCSFAATRIRKEPPPDCQGCRRCSHGEGDSHLWSMALSH